MSLNLEKYIKELDQLILNGENLYLALILKCNTEEFISKVKKEFKKNYQSFLESLPEFDKTYQNWYSESLAIIKILLPDRANDFIRLYEKPRARKEITCSNYVIEDCLKGIQITRTFSGEKIVGLDAAIPCFEQQLSILRSSKTRFESSLFDIKQFVQADLFDSELDAAQELNKSGFYQGAGAMAGVVLEEHLSNVCENHKIVIHKKDPSINDLNQLLKDNSIIGIPDWRFIQRLADLRNLCDHNKKRDPKKEEIEELITGVSKITKTIF